MSKIAFVLAATKLGPMIVPRLDYGPGFPGVGGQLLDTGDFDPAEVQLCLALLKLRRRHHGDGVEAIDGGANIGTHTIAMAREMEGWGKVAAFEPQERLFYALCGNVALNDLSNVRCWRAALSADSYEIGLPTPNYNEAGSYGSIGAAVSNSTDVGQEMTAREAVRGFPLDHANIQRLDFLKLDIEGMEVPALKGAAITIERHQPIILVERIKSIEADLSEWLIARGYRIHPVFLSHLAVHEADPCLAHIGVRAQAVE